MPITVKHGSGNIGALLRLALAAGTAGARQTARTPTPSVSRGGGGGGGGGRVGRGYQESAFDKAKAAIMLREAGPSPKEEAQQQTYAARIKAEALLPIKIQEMEARQRLQAEGWREQYSAKDRQEISRYNDSMQRVREGVAKGEIDPEIGRNMLQELTDLQNGVTKRWQPPNPNEPSEEQRPGFVRVDQETGITWVNDANGIPQPKLMPKDSLENLQAERESKLQIKQLEIQNKELTARRDYAIKLDEMEVPRLSPAKEGFFTDDPGGEPTGEARRLTEDEKRTRIEKYFPSQQEAPAIGQQEAPQSTGAFDQVFEEMKESLTFTKAEEGLPERVAMAQSFLREVNRRGLATRGSQRTLEAIQEALQIGAEYDAALRGQGR